MFRRLEIRRGAILFDPQRVDEPGWQIFEREHWRTRGALSEEDKGGRGSICFIEDGARRWALRRYLRGGLPALFARERYLFLGEDRTRSFLELRLLGRLAALGLPVPAPVAAGYRRGLVSYEAELITERLPAAGSLTELLLAGRMTDERWAGIGRCLRRFHDAGVQHADLTANNVMLGHGSEVWLLDFDRGRLREPGPWHEAVLARFERSLRKITRGRDIAWLAGFRVLLDAHGRAGG